MDKVKFIYTIIRARVLRVNLETVFGIRTGKCFHHISTASPTHTIELSPTRTTAANTIPSGRLSSNPQFVAFFRLRQITRT
jgi:hypothetical protein